MHDELSSELPDRFFNPPGANRAGLSRHAGRQWTTAEDTISGAKSLLERHVLALSVAGSFSNAVAALIEQAASGVKYPCAEPRTDAASQP
jgi:methyl coenzyme M reductase subunit C-like uncharacterized protein (methanogenesis marker protein 7)